MKKLYHFLFFAVSAAMVHPLPGQENSNWFRNLSEGMGATITNLQDLYPDIASSGNDVHTLWLTHAPTSNYQNYELNYRRSPDNGESWQSKIKLFEGALDYNQNYNRMVVSGNYVHIVVNWNTGTAKEVVYLRSTDGGASFESPQVLYLATYGDLLNLHISAQGNQVGISFTHECHYCGIKKTLYLLMSENNGGTFSTIPVLEDSTGETSDFANVLVEDNNVYMQYYQSIGYWANYDWELHLLYSNDGGYTFSEQVISVPAAGGLHHAFPPYSFGNGYCPKIAADGDKVWVVWSGWDENNQPTVFMSYSSDAGTTFSQAKKISGSIQDIHSGLETVAAKGNQAYVVFNSNSNKLYVNHSGDNETWLAEPQEFTRPNARFLETGIEPQMAFDLSDNGAFLVASGLILGKLSPQDKIMGPSFFGNYNFTVSRRPKLAISTNGFLHFLMEGGGEWLATGVFSDNDVWYRRLDLNAVDAGQDAQALEMKIIENPGDGSGLARFDNMIISPELAENFSDSLTVELWVKPEDMANEHKFITQVHSGTWNIGDPLSFQLWAHSNKHPVAGIMTTTGAYTIWGQKSLVPNFWNHLTVTYRNDGSAENFKLLLNGEVIAAATAIGSIAPSDAIWCLGSISGGNLSSGFLGSVDELRFWNRAKTPAEIRQERFTTLSGHETGLVAYYRFDAVSSFGEVADITGNGFNGHLMYKEQPVLATISDLKARFSYVQTVSTFSFFQHSNGGEFFHWDFGNGEQSDLTNPTITYQSPGVYKVCLDVFGNEMFDSYCEEVEVKGVEKIYPAEGGNTDYVTLYVYGGGLKASNILKLRRSGFTDIVADQTILDEKKTLTGLFNLNGQEIGFWDVVVADGALETIVPSAFRIVPGEFAHPYVTFNGGGRILVNRWTPQTITLGNSANIDAHGVLLWVTLPNEPGNDIAFLNLDVQPPQLAIDNGWDDELEALGYYIIADTLFGKPNNSRVYAFYFPILPAKSSFNIAVRVKLAPGANSVPVNVWLSGPFFESPISPEVQACVALSFVKAFIKGGLGFVPGVPCLTGTLAVMTDYLNDRPPTPSAIDNIETRSWYWILGTNLLECGSSLIPGGNVYAGVLGLMTAGVENAQENADCYSGFRQIGWLDILYYPAFSLDPNEKIGLPGYTPDNYIGEISGQSYQVRFENKNTATAPAQAVVILDTLTFSKYDLSGFSFGPFGWGDTVLYPLPYSKEFGMDVDLHPEKDLIVRVTGELDELEKIVKWRFVALDPATMDYVTDPLGGFLPPNLTPPEGEGFVSFTTGISTDIQNGDIIENKATILFDYNEPIITNLHKNTFDLAAPVSEINLLAPTTTDTLINLEVTSSDEESQVRNVEIWVSENDSAFVFSQSAHAAEVVFNGKYGSHYKFYSIAVDSVGNRETVPAFADTEVTILVGTSNQFNITGVKLFPLPAQNLLTLELNLESLSSLSVNLQDLTGRHLQALFSANIDAGYHRFPLRLAVVPGIYFLKISDGERSIMEKIVVME